jgi:hypothetical protein
MLDSLSTNWLLVPVPNFLVPVMEPRLRIWNKRSGLHLGLKSKTSYLVHSFFTTIYDFEWDAFLLK